MDFSHGDFSDLGHYSIHYVPFASQDEKLSELAKTLPGLPNLQEKNLSLSHALLTLIQEDTSCDLLLPKVLDFITKALEQELINSYDFNEFERYLNQHADLSYDEEMEVRGKIVGKVLPRQAYQAYFPIGMGKVYEGPHFVTAHQSPDLDTTVASFWGFMDAFAAKVATGTHQWNVPGEPPVNQIETKLLFSDVFGSRVFPLMAKNKLSLTLSSLDLVTQSGMIKKGLADEALGVEHDRKRSAVVLVDEEGYYLGDWRTIDVEGIRQVVIGLNNALIWMESHIHIRLISCFAKAKLDVEVISKMIREVFAMKLIDCEPCRDFSKKEKESIDAYLIKVLKVKKGLEATFEAFTLAIDKLGVASFSQIILWLNSLTTSELFLESGQLTENRPVIFAKLEVLVKMLATAFAEIRRHVDRLEIAYKIKREVFGLSPQYLTHRTSLEEIKSKMGSYAYLTVNAIDTNHKSVPIGVIHATDIRKSTLGTVTLRDFCNREEMKIPSYLEVISVIDHHKSSLETSSPVTASISDAQSSNVLLAEITCKLNDGFSTGNLDEKGLDEQIAKLQKGKQDVQQLRLLRRLLTRKQNMMKKGKHYISVKREFVEYLHFIYAILDDTDLLTKVSQVDVICIADLLNRLKSLMLRQETEIVHFDEIENGADFTKQAAVKLLQNSDFYSLYKKVYEHKEKGVEENLTLCVKGKSSNVFTDTKTLSGSSRVGQTKLFSSNYAHFSKHAADLHWIWYHLSQDILRSNSDIYLFMHMVSTVASADELYKGGDLQYDHLDELWIWAADVPIAVEKLKLFLSAFALNKKVAEAPFEIEYCGDSKARFADIFKESFKACKEVKHSRSGSRGDVPIVVLRFKAGLLNSRKSMIVPFLPKTAK